MTETQTLYDRAGGTPFFEALVGRFYAAVAADQILRSVYPEADLAPAPVGGLDREGRPVEDAHVIERKDPGPRCRHVPDALDTDMEQRALDGEREGDTDRPPGAEVLDHPPDATRARDQRSRRRGFMTSSRA